MDDSDSQRKQGTRVFKKSSPNGKVTVYLGKRDFIDHLTHIDPIDGVVLVDPEYLKERKVYAHVLAAFRYGREDLDVLGLTFRKDLFLASLQVYPPVKEQQKPPTRLQERLIKKLGPNAYPFFFELPPNAPASVTLQPAPGDTGKPCGVDYELKTYVAENLDEKPHKRNSIRLAIRKLTYAPEEPAPQPCAETSKDFMMSPGNIKLEATLDKEKYYHGESIAINVLVDNNTSKTVKKVKLSVRQFADICLFSTAQYKWKGFRSSQARQVSVRDLSVELPFTLTHPKPQESPPPSRSLSISKPSGEGSDQPVDTNLIQLDTNEEGYEYRDDDFIFEDFARLRLKGSEKNDYRLFGLMCFFCKEKHDKDLKKFYHNLFYVILGKI
ncbi:ARRB1-like protein [Mya arenaria]|uniref:ARRB1-like protein n=1 Tax=Mya arenaria TaxID=6604 RepID=A0ABY7G270_MYAAR|nr:ARRB1-like protein [Mya arenaria]